MPNKPEPIFYLDDHRGIYIPQNFVECTKRECISGVDATNLDALAQGPEGGIFAVDGGTADYWEIWDDVLNNAKVTDSDGTVYFLYQDGALWLIPEGMEYDEAEETWVWPASEEEVV